MHAEDLILVTGATGNTGSAVLEQLEARGASLRAMVRGQPDKTRLRPTSAAIVSGDFDDPRSLEAALEGVTRAYLVTPSGPEAEAQQVRFAESAAAAGVRHLVKLSQLASDEASLYVFFATMPRSNDGFERLASASRSSGRTCTSKVCSRSKP
jgi:uncharacterized protein YbjT (DUF2867 family)